MTVLTIACQAPLSLGFPRQEHWRWFPFPSPGGLLDPEIELLSPAWQVDSLPLGHLGSPDAFLPESLMLLSENTSQPCWPVQAVGLCASPNNLGRLGFPRRGGSVNTLKHQCGHETRTSSLISCLYFYYKVFDMYKRMYLI